MAVEIAGYANVPEPIRAAVDALLLPYGATVHEVPEESIAVGGLVVATKADMFVFNSSDHGSQLHRSFVGRCWDTPYFNWSRAQELSAADPATLRTYALRTLKETGSVRGFNALFVDGWHMNVRVLDVCLNDGMTDRISRMGPRMHDFLRAFTDWRLASIPESTPVASQA